ncbi:17722_t:CDS:2 [Cetraspora pellucida]|uniref:17722_t:CDS:1 n=1 Tax=Cetraspora pellucida TaxID=1433469 RepID=A0A9N8ZKL0_9GLOM|nr:17722_t:CDS:2 [Cetraspora pellucida]
MADPKTYILPLPKDMHNYFSSAPFKTCTFIEFLRRLDLEQKVKNTEQRLIQRTYMKFLNSLSVNQDIPQFARDHAKKLIKEMNSKEVKLFWDSIVEREKRCAAEEHYYKLLEQVRNKHVLIGGADVARMQKEYKVDEESLEASTEKKRKDKDGIESTPSTKKSRSDYEFLYTPSSSEMEKLPTLVTDSTYYDEDDEITIIRDVPQLSLENRDLEDDFFIEERNISKLFRQYQKESVNLANSGGLYVETSVHEILALTSIFMLAPNSHSEIMINIFGSQNLLDKIHKVLFPTDKRGLDAECESKFRRIIKQSINDSRDSAIKSSIAFLTENNSKENLGFVIFEGLRSLPNLTLKSQPSEMTLITNYLDYIMKELFHEPDKHRVEWPNTGLKESRTRKLEGRARQPDFIVSAINQLETSGTLFVGEVTSPAEKGNVRKNCNDLIRIGVFMKECIDSAIDKGADVKLLGFQCIEYTIDFYAMELSAPGLYFMYHIGQASIPTSVKTITHFIDDIETFLTAQDIFRESFVNFYDKLCNPKEQSTKAPFKRETLSTPDFNQLVSNTRNVKRKCTF